MDIEKWFNNRWGEEAIAHQKKMQQVREQYRSIKDSYVDLLVMLVGLLGIICIMYLLDFGSILAVLFLSVFAFLMYYSYKPRYCNSCSQRMKRQTMRDDSIMVYCDGCEVKIVLNVSESSD